MGQTGLLTCTNTYPGASLTRHSSAYSSLHAPTATFNGANKRNSAFGSPATQASGVGRYTNSTKGESVSSWGGAEPARKEGRS